MNVTLSCYGDRKGLSYIVLKEGVMVDKGFKKCKKHDTASLKEYIFEAILFGLKRVTVEHDQLTIEVQNNHVVNWLNGEKEYKGYETYLDKITKTLDNLDCRYLFIKGDCKLAKSNMGFTEEEFKLESIFDVVGGM